MPPGPIERRHVRLLGPCSKTGCLIPFCWQKNKSVLCCCCCCVTYIYVPSVTYVKERINPPSHTHYWHHTYMHTHINNRRKKRIYPPLPSTVFFFFVCIITHTQNSHFFYIIIMSQSKHKFFLKKLYTKIEANPPRDTHKTMHTYCTIRTPHTHTHEIPLPPKEREWDSIHTHMWYIYWSICIHYIHTIYIVCIYLVVSYIYINWKTHIENTQAIKNPIPP
jgi:hypothetical protein